MNLLESIGGTDLIRIGPSATDDMDWHTVYAKAEYENPSGSVKDRAAYSIVNRAIREGTLTGDKTILDATSGSTGIAYAMIGACLGYRVKLYIPANVSALRRKQFLSYGVELVETSPMEGTDGALEACMEEAARHPEKYFYANQYENEANWKAHYETTAMEIWEQTQHKVTHFVAGAGTGGTFTGTSRRLKELNPDIHIALVQPASPFHGIEGMRHMATTAHPGFFDRSLADEVILVETEDCYRMVRYAAGKKGLLIGISSGANLLGAQKLAKKTSENAVIVTVLCDGGLLYLDEPVWADHAQAGQPAEEIRGGGID